MTLFCWSAQSDSAPPPPPPPRKNTQTTPAYGTVPQSTCKHKIVVHHTVNDLSHGSPTGQMP